MRHLTLNVKAGRSRALCSGERSQEQIMEQIGRNSTLRGLESKKPIFFSKQFFTLHILIKQASLFHSPLAGPKNQPPLVSPCSVPQGASIWEVSPQGPHSHILMTGGGGGVRQRFIFYTPKYPNFRICLFKKIPQCFCISKFYYLSSGKLKHANFNFSFGQKQNYKLRLCYC